MTANEIAAAVQAGKSVILELWRAVERFAKKQALRWCRAWEGRGGVTIDDLMQCAFLALLDALESWKPDGGAFLTWYGLKLKAAFTAAYGQRTERERRDPLQFAISLETPLDDSEDEFTLADTVHDESAEAAFEDITDKDRWQRLHNMLEEALSTLPPDQAEALRTRYFLNGNADRMKCEKGLRALRHPSISRSLKEFLL